MVAKDELYDLFVKYKTDTFIETGTHMGAGIERAVDIGYERIFSIEIVEAYYNGTVEEFRNDKNVFLYFGDSVVQLPEILKRVKSKSTFWLDAHMSGIGKNCPILEELKAIEKHKIKNHNILIDDIRDFGTQSHDFITMRQVQMALLDINPAYEFLFESSSIQHNILAAFIHP